MALTEKRVREIKSAAGFGFHTRDHIAALAADWYSLRAERDAAINRATDAEVFADQVRTAMVDTEAAIKRAEKAERARDDARGMVGKARAERDTACAVLDEWQRRAIEAESGRNLLALTLKRREREIVEMRERLHEDGCPCAGAHAVDQANAELACLGERLLTAWDNDANEIKDIIEAFRAALRAAPVAPNDIAAATDCTLRAESVTPCVGCEQAAECER
jgi:hypothetical protein